MYMTFERVKLAEWRPYSTSKNEHFVLLNTKAYKKSDFYIFSFLKKFFFLF